MNSKMTNKQKLNLNSFAADFNDKEGDFILADLNVMLDEEEPSPVPLKHFLDDEAIIDRLLINSGFDQFVAEPIESAEQNRHTETEGIPVSDNYFMADFDPIQDEEDAIDRLLVDAGFDINNELEQDNGKLETLVVDDISPVDEVEDSNEIVVEPIEQVEQNRHTETEEISASDFHLMADFDPMPDSELALDKDATDVVSIIEENPETAIDKKQINDYENKVKKAAIITYTSLSFGIVALLSTVVMGIIISSVQTKVSKLTELVSILEEDMSNIAGKNSDLEINNVDSSVEQLNHKANGFTEQFEEQTQSSSDISENVKTADVTKQAAVNKSNDKQKTKTSVLENKKLSEAAIKKISAEKKGNNTQPAAGWSVNLTAYEDLNYAKSKAKNFIQKGIPVKVIAVDMNNTKWYRLKVVGFKNEKEATAYAAKIKKSLNLNKVFVRKN